MNVRSNSSHCFLFSSLKYQHIHHIYNLHTRTFTSVISMGSGREEENGMIAPMPNVKVGDVVIAKNPWGIGPKDEETADGKKLSFMRGADIAAVVEGTLLAEE